MSTAGPALSCGAALLLALAGCRAQGDTGRPCTTTVSYGNNWIHTESHPLYLDVFQGEVSWDGNCTSDGTTSYARLSNGQLAFFQGQGRCLMALDVQGCPATPGGCATHATYGPGFVASADHPGPGDDFAGRVLWSGGCSNLKSGESKAVLSNGSVLTFSGANGCELALRYTQCGGLYTNSVIPTGCPDPGVLLDDGTYYVACTSATAPDAFPIYVSTDLVQWTLSGHIFPEGTKPGWADGGFWAPEIHKVGSQYVAYFAARDTDGHGGVGTATASSPLGPFTAQADPLMFPAAIGSIDPTEFDDDQGQHYLVWKVDGNSVGQPTPILAQPLAPDGLSVLGTPTQLITNDLPWEGPIVEGPFVVHRGGEYFLFYSGNNFFNASYAIGVARATNPLGPYEKFGPPIVATNSSWAGPGHCSVVRGPSGEDQLVYHAWRAGCVDAPGCHRELLVDTIDWSTGWPRALQAPSAISQPLP